jgi:hypothetical protein
MLIGKKSCFFAFIVILCNVNGVFNIRFSLKEKRLIDEIKHILKSYFDENNDGK